MWSYSCIVVLASLAGVGASSGAGLNCHTRPYARHTHALQNRPEIHRIHAVEDAAGDLRHPKVNLRTSGKT